MNDTKFTPGPWHTWYEKMEISIYDQNSDLICGPIKQCPEQEANAHLIAAAPDMYKALDALCSMMSAWAINHASTTKGAWAKESKLEDARAALAKARGD